MSRINNYFGITASDSTASGLAQATLSGGYRSMGLKLFYRKDIMANIQIAAPAGVELYSNNNRKSSIVSENPETSAELSILWRF